MRSSVSAILSDPAPDSTMAFPDYQQSCTDHARLLVLITRIGHQISEEAYANVTECINQVHDVPIRDKTGLNRTIRVRYTPQYHAENNDWGEFQAHRKLVGIISVGSCASQVELNELCRLHESAKSKYSSTLFDSRCVVLCEGAENGIGEETGQHGETGQQQQQDNEDQTNMNGGDHSEEFSGEVCESGVDKPPSWFQPQNHKTRLLQFHGSKYAAGLRSDIQEFIASLFWVLESKRVEWSREGGDKSVLLCAPFERKDFVGLDMESRNNRKRILGRQKKHLGDLSLLAGLPAESWNYYQSGMDILRPANDWLWLAGCQEGLCAVSMLLQEEQEKGVSLGTAGLSQEEIIDKYRDCVNHYAKYKNAGIIETEASLKAVKYLVKNRSFLLASEFLQNIVFINLQLSDREKIERFISLSDLYCKIGFKRKAAFFQRVAAMRCVAPGNPQHDWPACYALMLKAVQGYDLDLASCRPPDAGWSTLQVQLLQELVGTSRKMGAHSASTRHMTYLFQNMFPCLSVGERQDFATQLSVLSQRAPANSSPLQLDDIVTSSKSNIDCDLQLPIILPPVNISVLPKVMCMTALPLPGNLAPVPAPLKENTTAGPFLFTPIVNIGGGSNRSSGRAKTKRIIWVVGTAGEVCLEVQNSLGVEVKVSSLALVTTGVKMETEPSIVMLDTHQGPQTIMLKGVPKCVGNLEIVGYTHSVLGVTSTCLIKDTDSLQNQDHQESIKVDVIPDLPLVDVFLEEEEDQHQAAGLQAGDSREAEPPPRLQGQHTPTSAMARENKPNCDNDNNDATTGDATAAAWRRVESLGVFGGERRELRLVVHNKGTVAATNIELTCQVIDGEGPEIEFDQKLINKHLPLKPDQCCTIPVRIIGTNNQNLRLEDGLSTTGSESRWSASAGYPSLQSRLSQPHSSSLPPPTPSSLPPPPSSLHGGGGEVGEAGGPPSLVSNLSSGGCTEGDCSTSTLRVRACVKGLMTDRWCRWSQTSLSVSQYPSIGVSRWDVLAGDRLDNCFLVLDLVNRSQSEVELTYSEKKQLLIEPGDTCRVPVPVTKCGFSESLDWREGGDQIQKYIQDRVNIYWAFTEGAPRSGSVSLRGVHWSDCMLEMVRRPPLATTILINSQVCTEGEEVEAMVGDRLQVEVRLENTLLEPIEDCRLCVKLEQDSNTGVSCAGSTGSPGLSLPGNLVPGGSATHLQYFLPLSPGQYSLLVSISLRFRCTIYSWHLPNLNLDITL